MLSCEDCQLLLADALYDTLPAGELDPMRMHLQGCETCRQHQAQLAQTKSLLFQRGIRPATTHDSAAVNSLDTMWHQLEPALDKIDAERYRHLARPARIKKVSPWKIAPWMALAASILLVISALPLTPDRTHPDATTQTASGTTINSALMDYLARAEAMLLTVANAEEQNYASAPIQQSFARNMALEANVLNTSMQDQINLGQSRLLKDIEFMLLQISNLDDSNMEQGVRLLQQYIEENSVLFKIRLLEMRNQDVFI